METALWLAPPTHSPVVPGVCVLEQVRVEARLRGRLARPVVGADPELEVALVVGGQLHADLDHLVLLVLPGDDALAVHAAGLVGTGLQER